MGHVDDRDPVGGQLPQDREQATGLALVERGVGLIEDEYLRALDVEAAVLDELALPDPELADRGVQVGSRPMRPRTGAARRRISARSTIPNRVGWESGNRLARIDRSGNRLSSW